MILCVFNDVILKFCLPNSLNKLGGKWGNSLYPLLNPIVWHTIFSLNELQKEAFFCILMFFFLDKMKKLNLFIDINKFNYLRYNVIVIMKSKDKRAVLIFFKLQCLNFTFNSLILKTSEITRTLLLLNSNFQRASVIMRCKKTIFSIKNENFERWLLFILNKMKSLVYHPYWTKTLDM